MPRWRTRSRACSSSFTPEFDRPRRVFDFPGRVERLSAIETKMSKGDFWSDNEAAQTTVAELKRLKASVEPWRKIGAELEELRELLPMAESEADQAEIREHLEELEPRLEHLEFQLMLAGPHDAASAFVAINPGAGGIDSCDWAEMLFRMYLRWAERSGLKTEILVAARQLRFHAGKLGVQILEARAYDCDAEGL